MSTEIATLTSAAAITVVNSSPTGTLEKTTNSCSVSLAIAILPGAVSALVCVIGVIVLNILQHHYLSIAFAIGTLTSCGSIYQGYQSHLLKTFQESNEKLKASILTLNQHNNTLKQSLQNLQSSNLELTTQVSNLNQTSNELHEQNQHLQHHNQELQSHIAQLRTAKEELEKATKLHLTRLESLQNALSLIHQATESDHQLFSKHLHTFASEVTKLQDANIPELITLLNSFHSILSKINQWKDSNFISQQISLQQTLSSDIQNLQQQIGANEELCKSEKKQIQNLRKIKEEMKVEFEFFKEQRILIEGATLRFLGGLSQIKN